jgi:Zn-dependent protease with chaperone function
VVVSSTIRPFASPHLEPDEAWSPVAAALLYACSVTLQLLCAWIRALVALPLVWLALLGLGWTSVTFEMALAIGFAPVGISILTLVFPYGTWLWQASCGGRTPSARERATYEQTLRELLAGNPRVRGPRMWFVTDRDDLRAAVYADSLMVTRGLLSSPWLPAVLAHELGHVNSSDGVLTAALHRLTTPPRRELALPWRAVSFFATGEAASWLLRLPWAHYWREREFAADAFTARLGQGQAFAEFLQTSALEHDLPVPFSWLSEHSHPSTEHRIDLLLQSIPRPHPRPVDDA